MAQAPARSQKQEAAHQEQQGLVVFEGFTGLNTQPSRYGLADSECAIMDGFFPAGNDNARSQFDNGPAIATFSPTNVYHQFGNIGDTPYGIVFLSDGSIWSLNTNTNATAQIAPSGTITNPAQGFIGVSQWGAQYILIVAQQTDGYFVWDGTTFYKAGDIIPGIDGPGPIDSSVLVSGGSGYLVNDTGTVTGGLDDATYIVTAVNMASLGTGYAPNDTGTVDGGNGDATYLINTVDGLGGVTGMHITAAGTNYLTGNDVTTTVGGGQPGIGTGLIINISVSSAPGPITGFTLSAIGVVTTYTLTSPGTLYVPGSASTVDGGAQPGVGTSLTLDLTVTTATMPSGVGGTAIETYASHVWIVNGPVLLWSAPASVVDFSTSNGGGSLTSNESSLRSRYTKPKQSNGYLYLFGDSSISYISGVVTTGSPPTTSFSLQNVDPEVGTPWPDSVSSIGSNIIFANAWGIHVAFGGRATKVSAELDGILINIAATGSIQPSAAKGVIFGRRVWMLLVNMIDQFTLQPTRKLIIWDEKRWCTTSQTVLMSFIAAQEIDSTLFPWGTDGNSIYQLCSQPSDTLMKTLRSKFWAPMSYAKNKGENRFWMVLVFYSGGESEVQVSIDSEHGPSPRDIPITPPSVIWKNNANITVVWRNNVNVVVTWLAGTDKTVVIPPTSCAQNGALVGFTLRTTAPDIGIISMATAPVEVQYRG